MLLTSLPSQIGSSGCGGFDYVTWMHNFQFTESQSSRINQHASQAVAKLVKEHQK